MFAFAGASTFPTIQADMKERGKFGYAAIIAITSKYAAIIAITSKSTAIISISSKYTAIIAITSTCAPTVARQRHCLENSKQIFPEIKLRGLVPSFHIHVSVSDLYIPTIGPPIF